MGTNLSTAMLGFLMVQNATDGLIIHKLLQFCQSHWGSGSLPGNSPSHQLNALQLAG
jgi:hypothetical protein